nr:MAG TPA: hypothetical protein [Caudoviricetes sp.]
MRLSQIFLLNLDHFGRSCIHLTITYATQV